MNDTKKDNKIIYQCGVSGCCPTMEQCDDTIIIKDDFDNVAKMTKQQLYKLIDAFLQKNPR